MKRVVRSLRSLTPRGFTLPEVLVTVAIIAVLASAVVPSVVSQLSKGNGPALQSDFAAIATAVNAFATDEKAYPARLSDLNTNMGSGTAGLCSTTYSSNWKGPYLASKSTLSSASSANWFKTTVYDYLINDAFVKTANHIAVSVTDVNGNNLTSAQISTLKQALDGATADYNNTSGNGSTGVVRFSNSGGTYLAGAVYVLLVPAASDCN